MFGIFELKPKRYPKAIAPASMIGHIAAERGSVSWYEILFNRLSIIKNKSSYVISQAHKVHKNKARYQAVEKETGVPWYVVGSIHCLEADCDFGAVLHNGERIIGKGKKTRLVPKGRGPFATWEASAIDALAYDGLFSFDHESPPWVIGYILKKCEEYNGTGYLRRHPEQNSPYVWACTSLCRERGKYTSDGRYDPNAYAHGQVGVAAIIYTLNTLKLIEIKYERPNLTPVA